MRLFLMVLFTTAVVVAAGQDPSSLPDGDGKAIITAACTSCHGLDLITPRQASRDEWSGIVERMKSYGTSLDSAQTTTVLEYLAKNFGPKGPTPDTPAPAGPTDAADAAGKAIVDGACSSCHAADLITSKKATRTEWSGIVDRMKGYGLTIDEPQTKTLLDYLEKTYGTGQPQTATAAPGAPAATDDKGKSLVDGYCGSCHGLELITDRTGTQAEWQDVVERMNGRGAGVPETDIPVIVQYLTKTYGRQ
jgi:mono/diheme cytochrome c family protein